MTSLKLIYESQINVNWYFRSFPSQSCRHSTTLAKLIKYDILTMIKEFCIFLVSFLFLQESYELELLHQIRSSSLFETRLNIRDIFVLWHLLLCWDPVFLIIIHLKMFTQAAIVNLFSNYYENFTACCLSTMYNTLIH